MKSCPRNRLLIPPISNKGALTSVSGLKFRGILWNGVALFGMSQFYCHGRRVITVSVTMWRSSYWAVGTAPINKCPLMGPHSWAIILRGQRIVSVHCGQSLSRLITERIRLCIVMLENRRLWSQYIKRISPRSTTKSSQLAIVSEIEL